MRDSSKLLCQVVNVINQQVVSLIPQFVLEVDCPLRDPSNRFYIDYVRSSQLRKGAKHIGRVCR